MNQELPGRPIPEIADAVTETCHNINALLDVIRLGGIKIKGTFCGLPIDLTLKV